MADRANQPFLEETIGFLAILLLLSAPSARAQKSNNQDRPQVPFGFTGLNTVQIAAYNRKAQPVAEAVQALNVMNQKGWQTIRKYYPMLGTESEKASEKVNPQDPEDRRFFAVRSTDNPGRSPMPLVVMVCSLDVSDVSGNLKLLHNEVREATSFEDFSGWPPERLHRAINELTQQQTTGKGVKYPSAEANDLVQGVGAILRYDNRPFRKGHDVGGMASGGKETWLFIAAAAQHDRFRAIGCGISCR